MWSELGVEEREMESTGTWKRAVVWCQQGATVVRHGCFNSRAGSETGPNKVSARASVPVGAGSVVGLPVPESLENGGSGVVGVGSLSAPESRENNESRVEISVDVDSWLEMRSMAIEKFVRGLETRDSGMCSRLAPTSSPSTPCSVSVPQARYGRWKLTKGHSEEQIVCEVL